MDKSRVIAARVMSKEVRCNNGTLGAGTLFEEHRYNGGEQWKIARGAALPEKCAAVRVAIQPSS
ncbi:hypothetical protein HYN43_003020 [Mucilaginibacter celer]|uniref:Uncharacterized protein n=1 Tax=Mucilaginibacter celer TaxID=2305508 RepID=A0A494VSG7_9SPHI|nr:hypothetical protein HYN43_003020 [Mucilaginibacter celer]